MGSHSWRCPRPVGAAGKGSLPMAGLSFRVPPEPFCDILTHSPQPLSPLGSSEFEKSPHPSHFQHRSLPFLCFFITSSHHFLPILPFFKMDLIPQRLRWNPARCCSASLVFKAAQGGFGCTQSKPEGGTLCCWRSWHLELLLSHIWSCCNQSQLHQAPPAAPMRNPGAVVTPAWFYHP